MQLEVGNIVEGRVTGITKFGAFVELPDGKTGMVHISEVAPTYVKEISDHLSENQTVKVKVLNVSGDGKISLSIKKCMENQQVAAPRPQASPRRPSQGRDTQNRGWQPKKTVSSEKMTFEDMLTKFKQTSDDKMSDLKRGNEPRRSSRRGAAK